MIAKYDLDGNGEIGIPDFLIFVDNFGKKGISAGFHSGCEPACGHCGQFRQGEGRADHQSRDGDLDAP